jgi:hypothetical protein
MWRGFCRYTFRDQVGDYAWNQIYPFYLYSDIFLAKKKKGRGFVRTLDKPRISKFIPSNFYQIHFMKKR